MENNMENGAGEVVREDCEDSWVIPAGATSDMNNVTSGMMGLLGQIENFVSMLTDSEAIPQPQCSSSQRLVNALQFLTMARDELAGEESCSTCAKHSDIEEIEQEVNSNQIAHPMDILKSHIDENLKLRKVKLEVAKVMGMISTHLEKIGLQIQVTSIDEGGRTAEASPNGTDICQGVDETLANGNKGTPVAMKMGEVSEAINRAALLVDQIAVDVRHVVVDDNCNYLESELEVTEYDDTEEVLEKGDYEVTKEDIDMLSDTFGGSTCGSMTTDDFTTEDEFSETGSNCSSNKRYYKKDTIAILNAHLKKCDLHVDYKNLHQDTKSERSYRSAYNFTCRVLDLEVEAEGRCKRVAKVQAALNMLRLIVDKQLNGSLPEEITHFSDEELKNLNPILESGVNENTINKLQKECAKTGVRLPEFKTLSQSGPNGEHIITVQCNALNHTAIGSGHNKRKARREAAKEILHQYQRGRLDQE